MQPLYAHKPVYIQQRGSVNIIRMGAKLRVKVIRLPIMKIMCIKTLCELILVTFVQEWDGNIYP